MKPVIVLGGSGHAKVVLSSLLRLKVPVLGCVVAVAGSGPADVLGVPVLGGEDVLERHDPGAVALVNGIGSIRPGSARERAFQRLGAQGWAFASVVDPTAIVAPEVDMAGGVLVMAGAIIQPGVRLGENVIVNTGARIDHDCLIARHVHVAPGVTLSGGVIVAEGAHLGTGATVIQGIRIGAGAMVAAGAVVVSDLPDGATAMGIPARIREV